ncbi:uncharacterized protein ACO6RY_16046 [Pungitius sinensis]
MRALKTCGCLSAALRALLIAECLLTSVRGDGAASAEQTEMKYVFIGGGIGLFLAAGYIIVKVCICRRQIGYNSTDGSMKKPSEPQPALSLLSQSEHPEEADSNDIQRQRTGGVICTMTETLAKSPSG